MSVTATITAARSVLRQTLLTSTCTKAIGGTTFACYYEQTQPRGGIALDFETGEGYGYTIYYRNADVTLSEGQAITVDGLTLEIQRLAPLGNLDPLRRAEATKR